ncbi:MAG: ABC-F family ATP-binding cassette domain-containing protein [Planctomycetaceae bacterium]|jgi:ATP-binding cassette subfamily F protein 3|nr:ABC-F family ATP-binding cassette domain-containing protein [Planctomycetaceae bacterium]
MLLSVEHIRKHFDSDQPVLADVTFQVFAGYKIGLVGPNGCGKTTLLNIIAGREELERGKIEKPNDVTIGYLEQRPEIVAGRTVMEEARLALAPLIAIQREAEEIAQKMAVVAKPSEHERLAARYDHLHEQLLHRDAYQLEHRIERILHGVGFVDEEFERPVEKLSGGELNRLSLAGLLLAEPDVMLLDEPSNHLDLAATEWLETFLAGTNAAILLVSHDRYFLDKVTNRTCELYHGTIEEYIGNFSAYTRQKEERLMVQTRTYEKYVEEIEKAKDFIRRNHYGMKAGQAEDRRKKLERLESEPIAPPRKIDSPPMNFPKPDRAGDIVFRAENLAKSFKATPLFHDAAFTIERGQRWAVIGPNGCGKTTLIRCLLHELSPDKGRVVHGQGVKIGYFDQQLHILDDNILVVDAVRPRNKKIMEDLERRKLLGAFGLTGEQQLQTVGSLSGGQRCRAALARLAAEEANVLILDEPTNHLDLWARAALEKAIREFEGTVLFISHDRYFVDHVADHLLIIQPNGRFRELEGNYTTYRHLVSRGLIIDPFVKNADVKNTNDSNAAVQQKNNIVSSKSPQKSSGQKMSYQKQTSQKSGGVKRATQGNQAAKNVSSYAANEKQKNNKHKKTPQEIKYGTHNPVDGEPPEKPLVETHVKQREQKRKRKFSYRKVSDVEQEIADHESMAETLEALMLLPETLRDGNRIREITAELNKIREKLQNLYAHWEEASELN